MCFGRKRNLFAERMCGVCNTEICMQCLIPNACVDKALCCAFCKEKCADRCKDKPKGCKYFSAEKYERKKEKEENVQG